MIGCDVSAEEPMIATSGIAVRVSADSCGKIHDVVCTLSVARHRQRAGGKVPRQEEKIRHKKLPKGYPKW